MTRAKEKARLAAFDALRSRVRQGGKLNPQSLAQSYGLTVAEVERVIERQANA